MARSRAERKMRHPGHWAPARNLRHYVAERRGRGPRRAGRLPGDLRTAVADHQVWNERKYMNERDRRDAGAPLDPSVEAEAVGDDDDASMLAADPLPRLESELESTDPGPDGEVVEAQTRRLLEEAWSLFTKCVVLRDGLLEASGEIERTMAGLQRQLGALPVAGEPNARQQANGRRRPVNGNGASTSSSNGASPH
jgi:hypothetical protein